MVLTSKIRVELLQCECEIEYIMFQNETSGIDKNPMYHRESRIVNVCPLHDRELRQGMIKEVKKNLDKPTAMQQMEWLQDVDNEIVNK